jgi:hypothetical protein
MADPQDRPGSEPDGESTPPPKQPPANPVKKAAKAPAKKAPAKKAPAKKAPAKKAPAKKVPAKSPEPAPPKAADQPPGLAQRIETNGQLDAAKDAAAHAKSTVADANNPVPSEPYPPAPRTSPVPLVVALVLSLLAILLVRQLRRR